MKIEISPYNPAWKDKYKTEAAIIKQKCGNHFITIEHAGSTSVEGLAAKPTIDIYIGTKTLLDAHNMINDMTALGYEYVTKYEKALPFRRYFIKKHQNPELEDLYHVHVTPAAHPFRIEDLLFRDYISVNSSARKDYESLKLNLSEIDWEQRIDYNTAKDETCQRIKKESKKFFGELYEQTESKATFLMHKFASKEACRKAKFSMHHKDSVTAVRTDIFTGFSLNRALGFTEMNSDVLYQMEKFFAGKTGNLHFKYTLP
jgi:GrpB-like predicted nucleotidyltransferase (UPF0157 family)